MTLNTELPIILKSDYLFNSKTGNGFVVSSEIIVDGEVIDVSPEYISVDLVNDVLNGERASKLKSFELVTIKKVIEKLTEDLTNLKNELPKAVFSNFSLKSGELIRNTRAALDRSTLKRGKPTMETAKITYHSEFGGKRKTIFEYSILTCLLGKGYSKDDFISRTEQALINNFQNLSERERKVYYENLKEEMKQIAL